MTSPKVSCLADPLNQGLGSSPVNPDFSTPELLSCARDSIPFLKLFDSHVRIGMTAVFSTLKAHITEY